MIETLLALSHLSILSEGSSLDMARFRHVVGSLRPWFDRSSGLHEGVVGWQGEGEGRDSDKASHTREGMHRLHESPRIEAKAEFDGRLPLERPAGSDPADQRHSHHFSPEKLE